MNTEISDIVIIGCGGHGRSVADVVLSKCPDIYLIFVDSNARTGEKIFGFPVVSQMPPHISCYHVALGNNKERHRLSREDGKICLSIISPNAYVSMRATIGLGVFIGHGAHVGPLAAIEEGAIINTNAVIEHETSVGSYCHIAPNSTLCGRCKIGSFTTIGAGAVIRDGITICSHVIVGAGAVVVKDIIEPGVYAGIPAREIKSHLETHL